MKLPQMVQTLEQLDALVRQHRCVTWRTIRMPAAFVMSMQARQVLSMMQCGMYEYQPKPKEKGK